MLIYRSDTTTEFYNASVGSLDHKIYSVSQRFKRSYSCADLTQTPVEARLRVNGSDTLLSYLSDTALCHHTRELIPNSNVLSWLSAVVGCYGTLTLRVHYLQTLCPTL